MHTTLISAEELALHLTDQDWVVVDCRHDLMDLDAGRAAYDIGHIAGAVFVNLETELSDPKHGGGIEFRGRHPLPSRTALVHALRTLGINNETQVVAYDAHGGMFAARLWWLLRWLGHPQVAVLDGGLAAWQALGLPMNSITPSPAMGNVADGSPTVTTVSVADLVSNLDGGKLTVIDARAPDRFRGENETMDPVGGHIPGAKNRFFKDNLRADGRFRPAAELKADFEALIENPVNAVMQCGSGVTACHNLLAMEVAGLPGAALYPGSWSEWCANPERPVER
ncbi:MAG: sulfurtransferase [Pseudomonadota bacterium]